MKKKIIIIAGARPNFMKISPIIKEIQKYPNELEYFLVHTGQHYDKNMSELFFEEFGIPVPNINLGIHGGSSVSQTARIMEKFEDILLDQNPDMVLVVGDVNSTFACAYCAKQNKKPLIHVEAGLRSFDRKMPEEINRLATDAITDLFFISERSGLNHLINEGVPKEKLFYVGNVMIDNLIQNLDKFCSCKKFNLEVENYCVATIHRPSNVDTKEKLEKVFDIVKEISSKIKFVWPIHPRTKNNISKFGLKEKFDELKNIVYLSPLGYHDFMGLVKDSKFVLTDSGGIQEETTYLQKPCITMRENTERPSTIELGGNVLTGLDKERILKSFELIMSGNLKRGVIPEKWDGRASERIVFQIMRLFC